MRNGVLAYLRARVSPLVFTPLCVGLAVLAVAGTGAPWTLFAPALLISSAVVIAARIWDDLEDSEYDARFHPRRAPVASHGVRRLQLTATSLAAVALVVIGLADDAASRIGIFVAVLALLAAWYRSDARMKVSRGVNAAIVLLKYPAVVCVAVPWPQQFDAMRLIVAATTAYLLVGLHEWLTYDNHREAAPVPLASGPHK